MWLSRVLTSGAAIVLAAVLAVVWVRVIHTLTAPSNAPRVVAQPGALVWDGRVFTTPAQLKRYLEGRGLSYTRWSARHPTAFGATAPVRRTTSTKTTTTSKPKPAHHRVASPTVSASKSRSLSTLLLTVLLGFGALAIGASAVVPPRLAPVAIQRLYANPDRRTVAIAVATAMLLSLGVSLYLS
jgi:hypothetical protein